MNENSGFAGQVKLWLHAVMAAIFLALAIGVVIVAISSSGMDSGGYNILRGMGVFFGVMGGLAIKGFFQTRKLIRQNRDNSEA